MTRLVCTIATLVALVALGSARAAWDEGTFDAKPDPGFAITIPKGQPPTETVIGRVRAYRIRKGDTLMDVARYFDVGYNEMLAANPYIDPWVPPAGATILLPTEWVLPCCTYEGVVVNIPEMRLYFYRRSQDDPTTTIVHTYPVGLGRDDWRTPSGRFKIRGKTVNPRWNIPESIRKEHIAERDDPRTFIAGGDPDNPLGKYRLELTLPLYAIHGTNIPWGVGMQVSHGCVRLYPEDIARLFPTVPVGAPGEFVYQPIKVGRRRGVVYVESDKDIYGYTPAVFSEAMSIAERAGLAGAIDSQELLGALEDQSGMPVAVSPAAPAAPAEAAAPDPLRVSRAPWEASHDGAAHQDHDQAGDD
jgi:L,D-transpeptidase ErfK/SrfK